MRQYSKGRTRWHLVYWRTEYSPHRVCDRRPIELTRIVYEPAGTVCLRCEQRLASVIAEEWGPGATP